MSTSMERIRASVIDGRALTPRFKQRQLAALHETLSQHEKALVAAIASDSGYSTSEASIQYFLSLSAVKRCYDDLDFEKLLQDEYSIAHGKDHRDRRTAIGYVQIRPDKHDLLYSAIVPLAAAIAAGNCAILEIQQTLSEVSTLLRNILPKALDIDTFAIVNGEMADDVFQSKHCCVIDSTQPRTQKVVAVVDRSADLTKAANALVQARMSFSGQSAYAPDFILVNEFCVQEFGRAAVQAALPYLSNGAGSATKSNGHAIAPTNSRKGTGLALTSDNELTILASGAAGLIAIARSRDKVFQNEALKEPSLIVIPISSLDDAIDSINDTTAGSLQALYTFGAPQMAKYMSQFIKADISFTNHIPVEILIGPVAPNKASLGSTLGRNSLRTEVHPRYTPDMFSVPCPEYINTESTPISGYLTTLLANPKQNNSGVIFKLSEATRIAPLNEPKGGAVGFFEQGIITGASLLLSTIVIGTATAVRFGYPPLARIARSALPL